MTIMVYTKLVIQTVQNSISDRQLIHCAIQRAYIQVQIRLKKILICHSHKHNEDHTSENINKNLEKLHVCKKSQILNTLESFKMYKALNQNKNLIINKEFKHTSNI